MRHTPVPQDDSRSRLRERASRRPVRTAWLAAFATTDGVVALTRRHAVGLVSISQNCILSREWLCALTSAIVGSVVLYRQELTAKVRVTEGAWRRAEQACHRRMVRACTSRVQPGGFAPSRWRSAWLRTVVLCDRCDGVGALWCRRRGPLLPLFDQCLTGADDPASDSAQA